MGKLWEGILKNIVQTRVNCKGNRERGRKKSVALTLGELVNGAVLPRLSCREEQLVQTGHHRLCSSVVCARGGGTGAWFGDSNVLYTQRDLGAPGREEKPPFTGREMAGASGLSAVVFLVALLSHKSLAARDVLRGECRGSVAFWVEYVLERLL